MNSKKARPSSAKDPKNGGTEVGKAGRRVTLSLFDKDMSSQEIFEAIMLGAPELVGREDGGGDPPKEAGEGS